MQPQSRENPNKDTAGRSDGASGNARRTAKTKAKITAAVIACLDEVGYSETSINKVQSTAGVSRGALTHHFPTKEAMVAETLDRLLDPVRGPHLPGDRFVDGLGRTLNGNDGIAGDMERLWTKILNTQSGRALVEILVAARTDANLQSRIRPSLLAYNAQINANIQNLYRSPSGDRDDIAILWTICRTFLRGLHLQARYQDNPEQIRVLINRFAQLLEPHMTARVTNPKA